MADESGDDATMQDPYSYLVGVVSLGPKRCGTAGVPGYSLMHFTFLI